VEGVVALCGEEVWCAPGKKRERIEYIKRKGKEKGRKKKKKLEGGFLKQKAKKRKSEEGKSQGRTDPFVKRSLPPEHTYR
jgi:hypothetical protein